MCFSDNLSVTSLTDNLSVTSQICFSDNLSVSNVANVTGSADELNGIRHLKSRYGSRVNRTNTASRSMLF